MASDTTPRSGRSSRVSGRRRVEGGLSSDAMPFARRDARSKAIAGFWHWWPGARGRVEAAIASGQWGDLPEEVGNRVVAIHPDLQWEFSKGGTARHALIVTPAGNAQLRASAARWRAA